MDIRIWGRKRMLLWAGISLALIGGLDFGQGTAGSPPTEGPQAPVEPNVVLSGNYSCNYTVTSYYVGPIGDPPTIETYAETVDNLTLSTTGGNVPVSQLSPPFRGIAPGNQPVTTTPVSGFGTGHSFNDGSIEDCVRFAQAMSSAARGLGCTTSDVRRRQPPQTLYGGSGSASFSLVCEGPQADIIHDMGELSRAVLALKPQPVP